MPFTTGTAASPSQLMQAINTLMVGNGWTRLAGLLDNAVASPKLASHWRILVTRTWGDATCDLAYVAMRETAAGAQLMTDSARVSTSGLSYGSASDAITTIAQDPNFTNEDSYVSSPPWFQDGSFWIAYEFPADQVVRSFSLKKSENHVNRAPRDVRIQWSPDGLTWTTMAKYMDIDWSVVDLELTLHFTFDTGSGYLDTDHVSANNPRRSGAYTASPSSSDHSNDTFMWKGPGYDADRPVFVQCSGHFDLAKGSHWLAFGAATSLDPVEDDYVQQVGARPEGMAKHVFWSNSVQYWIYLNSTRLILITRSGSSDYASTYVGFMGAFANPNDYPFPLICSSSMEDFSSQAELRSRMGSMCDPGEGGSSSWRRWDGVWINIENRFNTTANELYKSKPRSWIWPYHFGMLSDGEWPYITSGDDDSHITHWMNQIDATEQGEIPMIPCVIVDNFYGCVGSLQGVYAIASGGALSPEQVIDVGGVNYRVFCNRSRRLGNHYFAVRED